MEAIAVCITIATITCAALAYDIARRKVVAQDSSQLVALRAEVAQLSRDLAEWMEAAVERHNTITDIVRQKANEVDLARLRQETDERLAELGSRVTQVANRSPSLTNLPNRRRA